MNLVWVSYPGYPEPNKSLSYLMIGLSVPGKSDGLQYFWILQFGSCTGVYLNGMQYFTLFPNQLEGFYIYWCQPC